MKSVMSHHCTIANKAFGCILMSSVSVWGGGGEAGALPLNI